MELVYLWVEDYKNIKKQGFNFSPQFHCTYGDVKNELTINENDNYISGFFAENINIMAIVGKNGSGKSSVLKAFLEKFITLTQKDNFDKAKIFINNKQENIDDTFLVYWDYSITDESLLDVTINDTKKLYVYDENNNFLLQPSKVDSNFKSNIAIIEDIKLLAKSLYSDIDKKQREDKFFKICYVQIASKNEIKEYSSFRDKKEIKEYFKDYYFEHSYKYFYKVPIRKIDKTIGVEGKLVDFIFTNAKGLLFLSFGEIQFLKILYNIKNLIQKITKKNIIFLLDEIELGLHPEWQKKLINYLSTIKVKKNKKVNFILTTHSPFMLSDLPKENIIFLDKYNNKSNIKYPNLDLNNFGDGDCINVSKELEIKPFGANIHNLLSHGFFMDEGLMGEFALKKIQKIVDFYNAVKDGNKHENYNDVKKEFYFIRDNIGEEYIKGVITNHIEFIEEKLGEESFRDNRINELEKEIAELKAKK